MIQHHKLILSLLLVASLFTGILSTSWLPAEAQSTFPDLEDYDHADSIEFLTARGIVSGYPDGNFYPDRSINRAELLKMAYAGLGQSADGSSSCFTDVRDEWFAPYICEAKESGVVNGYDDGSFKPGQAVNMAEAFKMLTNSYGFSLRNAKSDEAWYEPYAEFMHANDLASKYAYYPWRDATRGEVAFWLHQLILIDEKTLDLKTVRDPSSAACGHSAPAQTPNQFWVDGVARSAIVEVPQDYDPNHPYSLILAFHGRTNSNSDVRSYYRLNRVAGDEAIIVYPAGQSNGSSYSWSDPGDASSHLRDYALFDVIVNEMKDNYCINEDEIYAVGHSLGAWFVNSLACARGDVLRAVGSLGGARSESTCSGPVSVMQFHNPNDRLAPFYTGLAARDNYLDQNYCSDHSTSVEPSWGNCIEYTACMDNTRVIWCPHTEDYADYDGSYYPHNWPRETGGAIWDFFQGL